MIIWRDQPLANDHSEGQASCKWSSGWTGLLEMITWMDEPLANDHLEGPASCKWSFRWNGPLQIIFRMDQPVANGRSDGLVSCKWSIGSSGFSSIFLFILQQISPTNIIFSFKTFRVLQILGSRFNLADLSRTICSCYESWVLCHQNIARITK